MFLEYLSHTFVGNEDQLLSLLEALSGGNMRVVEEAKRRIAHLEQTQADRTLIRTLANE